MVIQLHEEFDPLQDCECGRDERDYGSDLLEYFPPPGFSGRSDFHWAATISCLGLMLTAFGSKRRFEVQIIARLPSVKLPKQFWPARNVARDIWSERFSRVLPQSKLSRQIMT